MTALLAGSAPCLLAFSALLLGGTLVLGAFDDRLDAPGRRTLEDLEPIPRMHPVQTTPEVEVGADSTRMQAGAKVRSHFGKVARLRNGHLIVVYNEQETSAHSPDPTIHMLVRTSPDGGYTWSQDVRVDTPVRDRIARAYQIGHAHHGLVVHANGDIWLAPVELDDERLHIPRSRDGGRTWDFELIAPDYMRDFHLMSNGELIAFGCEKGPEGLRMGRAVYITDASASRWEAINLREQSGFECDEAALVETATPGEIYMLMRDQDRAHYYHNAWSSDYGRTWHGYAISGIWYSLRPSMPFVTRTRDGILLAVNSERSNGRQVITPSFDGGRTWDLARRIFFLDAPGPRGSLGGSHGYCTMAEVDDDTWFVTWYDTTAFRGATVDIGYIRRPHAGLRLSAAAPLKEDPLIGRWSFEDDRRDYMVGSPHRDDVKAERVARDDGPIGRAARFNGTTSLAIVRDAPTMRVPSFFSVECSFRAGRIDGEQALVAKRPFYYLGLVDDRLTFQLGPGADDDAMPTFRVDAETPIAPDRWYHVVATVGTPHRSYKGARLYLDGAPVGYLNLSHEGMGRDWSYAKAAYYLDRRPEHGPMYMNYGEYQGYQALAASHLHFGVDNTTRENHFQGALDEVALYGRCLAVTEVRTLAQRAHASRGAVTTDPIPLDGDAWGVFQADTVTPADTAVRFDVLAADGDAVLVAAVEPGDSLHALKVKSLRLRAELTTADPKRTPVLKSWAITGSGDD